MDLTSTGSEIVRDREDIDSRIMIYTISSDDPPDLWTTVEVKYRKVFPR